MHETRCSQRVFTINTQLHEHHKTTTAMGVIHHIRTPYRKRIINPPCMWSNIRIVMTTKEFIDKAEELYLDYVNNFITVERFAEHNNLTFEQAELVIQLGKSEPLVQ